MYRQAIPLLTELRSNAVDQEQYDRYVDGAFDAQTIAFLQKHAKITELIRQGAAATTANWGEMDMPSRLTELNSIRSLFNLVMIESRFAMHEGNTAVALEDALAGMALAHHLGQNGMLTSKMVEIACDTQAIYVIAHLLQSLTSDQLTLLSERLAALPKPGTGAQMMAAEFAYARTQRSGMLSSTMVNSMESFYKDAGVALDTKSPAEFDKWIDAEVPKYVLNPPVKILTPSLKKIRRSLAVVETNRALLNAAIRVESEGESAVAKSVDPFGTGPFQYRKTSIGFTLSSQLHSDDDKAVELVIGN
jgi:hypothetical protein